MAHERFKASKAALLLIDHQVGTAGWMHPGSSDDMKRNTLALAKAAAATGMSTVMTSSQENQADLQGAPFSELADLLPEVFASRIKRGSTVDPTAHSNFAAAEQATGRKELIMAGLLTEVCVLYPTLSAVEDGCEVQVVADASGSGTKAGDDVATTRMRFAGAHIASAIQISSGMVDDWPVGAGPEILGVLGEINASLAEDSAA